MIDFPLANGWICRIIEDASELPDLTHAKVMFADCETTSKNPKVEAFLPYLGHRIAGLAIVVDDEKIGYYIPVRHARGKNIPVEAFQAWLKTLGSIPTWVNHNIKFDAHFFLVDGVKYDGRMVDTLTMAKMHDSDRMGHDLKPLCREWLSLQMEEETRVKGYLKGIKSKDYGDVPIDILGPYAVMDVFGGRALNEYLDRARPADMAAITETEIALTSVLFDIEIEGLEVHERELKLELRKSLEKLILLGDRLNELTHREFSDAPAQLFDLMVNQLGLPVLSYNPETGNPSFDAEALALYSIHPQVTADPVKKEVVESVIAYRKETTFKGLFLEKFLELKDENNTLHSSYNQLVRTGRMSCRNPNSQQNSPRSKALVHPRKGRAFLAADASQIEFRLIIHYANDLAAIAAYRDDPDTDFHQWVADICHIKRKQAKNVNFAIGYGAGKKKVVAMLSSNPEVMAEVGEQINAAIAAGTMAESERAAKFKALCVERANAIYYTYHERLPNIKAVSRVATQRAKVRGYVFNAFGRRRHLPPRFAHKAFNSVVQGCAMDYIKERMVAIAPRFCKWMRDMDIRLVANVHDEILFEGPIAVMRDPATWNKILDMLEIQTVKFRVPFTWSMGYSETTWAEASGDNVVVRRGAETVRQDAKKYERQEGDVWLAGPVPVERQRAAA